MAKRKISNSQFTLTNTTINYLSALDLMPSTKLVVIYLTTCYNVKNKFVYPKQKTIVKKLGISEKTVIRAIRELVDKGYCTKTRKAYDQNYYAFTDKFFSDVHFIDLKENRSANIDYDLWREAIFKKYNNTCQLCGKASGLMHAHHKKEYANNPEKRYDISNGILLCAECHKKLHPWMK